MSPRPGRGRHDEEEHENHERWLVTYADMVTLLMVLFIVMFAMSQVDEKKFNALKEGLAAGFGSSEQILVGSRSLLDQPGSRATAPLLDQGHLSELDPETRALVEEAVSTARQQANQARYAEAAAEVDRLEEVLARLEAALARHGLSGDVRTTIDDRGLVVSLVSRHVVFEPNLATLSPRGRRVVDTLAPVLRDLPDPLQIDGHTNQVPVAPKYFPTDWELSAARALTVLRHLNEENGLPSRRLSATAFGHEKPLVPPRREGSQQVNKRVDIVILSSLSPESRTYLDNVVLDRAGRPGELVPHRSEPGGPVAPTTGRALVTTPQEGPLS